MLREAGLPVITPQGGYFAVCDIGHIPRDRYLDPTNDAGAPPCVSQNPSPSSGRTRRHGQGGGRAFTATIPVQHVQVLGLFFLRRLSF